VAARICGARRSVHPPQLAVGSTLSLPPPAGAWDVRPFCATVVDDQGNSEKCVGEMVSLLHWIATRGAGKRLSPRGAYENGRAREVESAKGAPIPDTGSNPSDVVDAAIAVGVFAVDERENDPNQTELLTFAEGAASVLVPPESFVPLAADTHAIDTLGSSGFGVGFCMEITPSYQALRGPVVWQGPAPGEVTVGGHAQVIVASLTLTGIDVYAVRGSWGTSWADGGTSYIPRAWIAANGFDLIAMTGGPTL
jgi:hypothetical protein